MLKIKGIFKSLRENVFVNNNIIKNINSLFSIKMKRKIDDEILLELKKTLLEADVGSVTTIAIIDMLKKNKYSEKEYDVASFKLTLSEIIKCIISSDNKRCIKLVFLSHF